MKRPEDGQQKMTPQAQPLRNQTKSNFCFSNFGATQMSRSSSGTEYSDRSETFLNPIAAANHK
jgi:hypothetical protein